MAIVVQDTRLNKQKVILMKKSLLQHVYDHSNDGLDIIFDVCPQAVDAVANKRKFRLRSNEHTPSACVYPPKDANDCWHVKDFGMGEGEGYFSPLVMRFLIFIMPRGRRGITTSPSTSQILTNVIRRRMVPGR